MFLIRRGLDNPQVNARLANICISIFSTAIKHRMVFVDEMSVNFVVRRLYRPRGQLSGKLENGMPNGS